MYIGGSDESHLISSSSESDDSDFDDSESSESYSES